MTTDYALLIQSPAEWGPIAERLGLPVALLFFALFTAGYMLRKWIIPEIQRRFALADQVLQESTKRADDAARRAEERIERADQMRETVLRHISDAMQEQARLLKEIRDDVRPRRR